jgi:uncharacterized protein (TIGR02569 family)
MSPLRSTPPPPGVCADFGVLDAPVALTGGQGGAWRVGRLVLKRVGRDPVIAEQQRWLGTALDGWPVAPGHGGGTWPTVASTVRVAVPVAAANGTWVVGGWAATTFLDGQPAGWDWAAVLDAGRRFHEAVAHLPRPTFLRRRESPWDTGDRMAWDERPLHVGPALRPLCLRLAAALRPVPELRPQLVHGDLGGNVLVLPDGTPAVIDLSPYWRPPGWALAVVAVDALAWGDADPSVLDLLADEPEIEQLLLRAMLYRLVTDDVVGHDTSAVNEPIVDLLLG